MDHYGILPYCAQMSCFKCTRSNDEDVILYDDINHRFFKISATQCETYPFALKAPISKEQIALLSDALIVSKDAFIDILVRESLIHKRAIKKITKKKLKKGSVKA